MLLTAGAVVCFLMSLVPVVVVVVAVVVVIVVGNQHKHKTTRILNILNNINKTTCIFKHQKTYNGTSDQQHTSRRKQ